MGLGESVLHLEGKRDKDKQLDAAARLENKRKNREALMSIETKRRKAEAEKKREEKRITYSSVATIAKLCSGSESCCSERCLEVRHLHVSYFPQQNRIRSTQKLKEYILNMHATQNHFVKNKIDCVI